MVDPRHWLVRLISYIPDARDLKKIGQNRAQKTCQFLQRGVFLVILIVFLYTLPS